MYVCMYMYVCIIFFRFFSLIGYFKILGRVSCAIQQDLVVYLFIYSSVYMLIPHS